jgi:hypothetical protein
VSVLTELDAFYVDHRRCGELEAGIDEPVVWIACDCGARMARRADEDDYARPSRAGALDLIRRPPHHPGMSCPAKLHRTCGCKSRLSKRRCAQ